MKKFYFITLLITTICLIYSCSKLELKMDSNIDKSPSAIISSNSSIVEPGTIDLIKKADLSISQSFTGNKSKSLASGIVEEVKEIKSYIRNGLPFFYVINSMDNNGWVILSADLNYSPVLAFKVETQVITVTIQHERLIKNIFT